MDQFVRIEKGDTDEVRDLDLAMQIGKAIEDAYPHHYWIISFAGHNLIVRHVMIANMIALETGKEGFGSLLPRDKIGTVHNACKIAAKFAGALLETFRLPRGPWDGITMPVIPEDLKSAIRKGKALKGWGNK